LPFGFPAILDHEFYERVRLAAPQSCNIILQPFRVGGTPKIFLKDGIDVALELSLTYEAS
jgi:hypothetical protein